MVGIFATLFLVDDQYVTSEHAKEMYGVAIRYTIQGKIDPSVFIGLS